MADSREDVASQALARLGEPPISAFDEATDAAEKVSQLYESTVLSILGKNEWKFASAREVLSIDGAIAVVNEWRYAYLMPALRIRRVGNPVRVYNTTNLNAPPIFDYELQGAHLLTNQETIVIEFIERKAEALWPGYFEELVVEALAARLALPITEIAAKEEWHTAMAYGTPSENREGGLFGAALRADARYQPTRGLLDDDDPITEARFGGSRRDGRW